MKLARDEFIKIKESGRQYYKSIGKVYCPYFKEAVVFNTKGYRHLIFNSWNAARTQNEQHTRLKILPYAVKILEKSHTLQEYNKRDERYYVFVAIMDNLRLKVVVRKSENGIRYFYSVYPSWKVNGKDRILCFSDLEE